MQQIRYFIAVAETLNFTRAAERCHVTQPSLTRAIQALEAEFGGQLIRRERSLSHLTELGMRMLPLMQQCFESALAAKSLAHAVKKGEISPLSIAISQSLSLALFAPTLRELARAFPGMQLVVRRGSSQEIANLLRTGEVEIVIAGPLSEEWERLDAHPIFVEDFDLFVGDKHKLAKANSVEFGEVLNERFLINDYCEMAEDLMRRLSAAGVPEGAGHRIASDADLIVLLEAGLGVAIVPLSTARSANLRRVHLNGLEMTRTVTVYSVAGRRRARVGATMLNMLRAASWPAFEAQEQRLRVS